MKELMQELVEAMVESATDKLGNGYPEWRWYYGDSTLVITTQQSRDPRRSSNGGEYYAYTNFEIRPDGVEVWEDLSCELISVQEYKDRSARIYPISLTKEGLERMAHLASARALQQIAPDEALDPEIVAIMDAAIAMFDSPKAGIGQLKIAVREYEVRDLRSVKPRIEEMSASQCYDELDRLAEYRRTAGRGRNPDACQARHYCGEMRKAVKKRLKQLEAPLTRPGDKRIYGPGAAAWQRGG